MIDGQTVINIVMEESIAKALSWELQPAEVIRSVKAEKILYYIPCNELRVSDLLILTGPES